MSATVNRGLAYMHLKKYAKAEECFRQNLHLIASTYFNLGLTLSRQEKFEEALVSLKLAVELEPENPEYWNVVGNAYADLNRWEEAKAALMRAIDIDDTHALAHYDLGCTFAKMTGHEEEALKSYHRATSLIENDPLPYYGISCIYALQGKNELALDFLEKSLQKGYTDWDHIDADTDLDTIRKTKNFKN